MIPIASRSWGSVMLTVREKLAQPAPDLGYELWRGEREGVGLGRDRVGDAGVPVAADVHAHKLADSHAVLGTPGTHQRSRATGTVMAHWSIRGRGPGRAAGPESRCRSGLGGRPAVPVRRRRGPGCPVFRGFRPMRAGPGRASLGRSNHAAAGSAAPAK